MYNESFVFPVPGLPGTDIAIWHKARTDVYKVQVKDVKTLKLPCPSQIKDGCIMIPGSKFNNFYFCVVENGGFFPDSDGVPQRGGAALNYNGMQVKVPVNSGVITVNEQPVDIAAKGASPAYSDNDMIYTPVKAVMKALGAETYEDAPTGEIMFIVRDCVKRVPAYAFDSSHLVPLDSCASYKGYEGGLYPGGKNTPPANYQKLGMEKAAEIKPLDQDGKPSEDGKIVLLSLGMSNAHQDFDAFETLLGTYSGKSPELVTQNGCVYGHTVQVTSDKDGPYWKEVARRLAENNISPLQVQAVYVKEASGFPNAPFLEYAEELERLLDMTFDHALEFYPNIKIIYITSRTYGGFAQTKLNPEPYAYEAGFAMKWLIEKKISGMDAGKPYYAWGPYLWANGSKPNTFGMYYEHPEDFRPDGTHPSEAQTQKVADIMLRFFINEPTAKGWFLK